jgi:acyl-CoA thioester hydrolase
LGPPRHETTIRVGLRDLDGLGHVNHAVYLTYIEEARTEYVLRLKGGRRLDDFDFVLARIEADFRSQATLGDVLVVEIRPTRLGTRSWDLHYRIRDAETGDVVVESTSVLVSYDFGSGRTMPVPEPFRTRLAEEIAAAAGEGGGG